MKNKAQIVTILFVIGLVSPIGFNLYLPSLPGLRTYFTTSDDVIELTIPAFLLGLGLFQLIYGPLSDHFGRRKILLWGHLIGILGAVGSVLAHTPWELIIARFIVGSGTAATTALGRSILRDCFTGDTLTKIATMIFTVFSLIPLMATLMGSYIDAWFGWKMLFIVVLIYIIFSGLVVLLFFSETNKNLKEAPVHLNQLFKNYWQVFSHPVFLSNTLCASCALAGITIYNTLSPFLFQEKLNLTVIEYGWVSGLIAFGMTVGRLTDNFFIRFFSMRKIMLMGQMLMLITGIILLALEGLHIANLANIITVLMFFMIGTAFVIPFASLQSILPFSKDAGLAGGLYGGITLFFSSTVSFIVTLARDNFLLILGTIYTILAIAGMLASWWSHHIGNNHGKIN